MLPWLFPQTFYDCIRQLNKEATHLYNVPQQRYLERKDASYSVQDSAYSWWKSLTLSPHCHRERQKIHQGV